MAGKLTDRKKKDTKPLPVYEPAPFTLPDSLPCSEIEFPVRVRKPTKANWNKIVEESRHEHQEIEQYIESKKEVVPKSPFRRTECDYIKNEIYICLLPALEETLNKAKIWNALLIQKCFFNGIDHIAQVLWNNNPRHPARLLDNHHIFNMPWVRNYLKEHPRPYYPKSWLWPEDYAATLIQKTLRQYFVQREDDVQEMRDFWRKLEVEQSHPEMVTNPFLAKKFASESNFKKAK